MPLVGTSPWADAANFGAGFGNQVAGILEQQPLMRMRQLQMLQDQRESNANISQLGAHAGLYNAQAAQLNQQNTNQPLMNQAAATFAQSLSTGDKTNAYKAMGDLLAHASPSDMKDFATLITRVVSTGASGLGQPGAKVDPANAAAATGMEGFITPRNIPANNIQTDALGNIMNRGIVSQAPGVTDYVPPGVSPLANAVTSPVQPRGTGGFNPSSAMASFIKNNPDASVEQIVDFGNKLKQGMSTPTGGAPSGKVAVKDPSGKPGFIPQEQLQEALKQGYTQ